MPARHGEFAQLCLTYHSPPLPLVLQRRDPQHKVAGIRSSFGLRGEDDAVDRMIILNMFVCMCTEFHGRELEIQCECESWSHLVPTEGEGGGIGGETIGVSVSRVEVGIIESGRPAIKHIVVHRPRINWVACIRWASRCLKP